MSKTVNVNPGGTIGSIGSTVAIGAAAGVQFFGTPTGKIVKPLHLSLDVTCSATVGNRVFYVWITDATGNISWLGTASANVAASQVCGYDVGFGCPLNTPSTTVRRNRAQTANVNVMVRENTSITLMKAGAGISIDDTANIDVADSVSWRLTYVEYDI